MSKPTRTQTRDKWTMPSDRIAPVARVMQRRIDSLPFLPLDGAGHAEAARIVALFHAGKLHHDANMSAMLRRQRMGGDDAA